MVRTPAQSWGRRPVTLMGFVALPIRTLLFASNDNPLLMVCYQALDGVSASVVGVMLPLVVADITRRGGRFNLGMGLVGLAVGIGATLSNSRRRHRKLARLRSCVCRARGCRSSRLHIGL